LRYAGAKAGETIAVMTTNQGVMKLRLFSELVPNSVSNFVQLAKEGRYSDVPFHRVIRDFMIQGGDFTNKNGTGGHAAGGPGSTIGDEYHPELKHIRGALSYAKTDAPKSIGSQFFIVHPENGTHFLDHKEGGGPAEGYTVFGQLFEGLETLDKIASAPTNGQDLPNEPMTIEKIEISIVE
jgi:peptidyl-prolyl cis-trans isomerase B (cyclophilin B)